MRNILKTYSIFKIIESFSLKIASKIYNKDDSDDVEFWEYQSFKWMSQIFIFGIGLTIAYVFGHVIPMCIVSILFAFIRNKIGGYHSWSFCSCFFVTQGVFIIGSLLAVNTIQYPIIMFLISIFGAIWITSYIPKPSFNTPERGELRKIYFRTVYRNRILLLYILNVVLLYFIYIKNIDLRIYSTSISSSIITVVIVMSNIFDKIMKLVFKNKIYE